MLSVNIPLIFFGSRLCLALYIINAVLSLNKSIHFNVPDAMKNCVCAISVSSLVYHSYCYFLHHEYWL